MKNIFSYVYNKCKQYTNRIFYTDINNSVTLHYAMFMSILLAFSDLLDSKLKNKEPYIVLISGNFLFKTIVFTYCFLTGTRLVLISPKFQLSEIVNIILSRAGTNVLLLDTHILFKIQEMEEEEYINILGFFEYIDTTAHIMENLLENEKYNKNYSLSKIYNKGRANYESNPMMSASILSPGTSYESCIVNVPYQLFGKSMLALSYFMGLKPSDKVSVIADFEFHPNIYTILGLITGIHYVSFETEEETQSGEEIANAIKNSNHKPNVILISSNKFKKVWDTVLLNTYSNRIFLLLSKCIVTKWITNMIIRLKVQKIFGKEVKKVHILNEELGFHVLDILKKSKIMFSSSYGFLEQGNFLAFKDPELFGHKDYIYKSGGTLLRNNDMIFKNIFIDEDESYKVGKDITLGEICLEEDILNNGMTSILRSEDLGFTIPNVLNQGDRKYLYMYGRKQRDPVHNKMSLDLLEKSLKDTLLIRDCLVRRRNIHVNGTEVSYSYDVFIELREDLLDITKANWQKVQNSIVALLLDVEDKFSIKIENHAILNFDGIRNVADKIQYYLI